MNKALVQVLGAVAYGELKAYALARAEAEKATTPDVRRRHRVVAAEELRHHKGFIGRLEAMGADPERSRWPASPTRTTRTTWPCRKRRRPVITAILAEMGAVSSQPLFPLGVPTAIPQLGDQQPLHRGPARGAPTRSAGWSTTRWAPC